MRNKHLSLEGPLRELGGAGLEDVLLSPEGERGRLKSDRLIRAALRVAISQELTRRQRECVEMYFGQRMTMEGIGEALGIGKSTVYKHIQCGKERIRRVLAYAEAFQKALDEMEAEED